jgi:uncharacterized SAM-binding protein YcdF (DUF218 family)
MRFKTVKKVLIYGLILMVAIFSTLYGLIVYYGSNSLPKSSDCIIVLGCMLWDGQPSPILARRLDKAAQLYSDDYGRYIIVSGGQGPGETLAEAEAMEDYLISKGIPKDVIIKECRAASTLENVEYSLQIMDDMGLDTAVIVTTDYHLYRAMVTARRLGVVHTGAPAAMVGGPLLRLKYNLREVVALFCYMVRLIFV